MEPDLIRRFSLKHQAIKTREFKRTRIAAAHASGINNTAQRGLGYKENPRASGRDRAVKRPGKNNKIVLLRQGLYTCGLQIIEQLRSKTAATQILPGRLLGQLLYPPFFCV